MREQKPEVQNSHHSNSLQHPWTFSHVSQPSSNLNVTAVDLAPYLHRIKFGESEVYQLVWITVTYLIKLAKLGGGAEILTQRHLQKGIGDLLIKAYS